MNIFTIGNQKILRFSGMIIHQTNMQIMANAIVEYNSKN